MSEAKRTSMLVKFRKLYIDPELQFPMIITWVLAALFEIAAACWGVRQIVKIARHLGQIDPAMGTYQYLILLGVGAALLLAFFNFLLGLIFSRKIAAPLMKLNKSMEQLGQGNLEVTIIPETWELLRTSTAQFNEMAEHFRHILYRDHRLAQEVNDSLSHCLAWLEKQQGVPQEEQQALRKLIKDGKSRISIINAYFMQGKPPIP